MRSALSVLVALVGLALVTGGSEPAGPAPALDRSRDSVHALAVFVRFPDDDGRMVEWPDVDASGRPVSQRQLPPFGVGLFEADPDRVRASTLTLGDSSLSAYFYWQSRNGPRGPHILTGEVWPRDVRGRPVVYVAAHENAYYTDPVRPDGSVQNTGVGYGELTREIVDVLVADTRFDIRDYDRDGDGVLDHLFLVVRRDIAFWGAGVQSLAGYQRTGGPFPRLRYPTPDGGAVEVRAGSGSVVWIAEVPPRASLAHEYGHDLFEMNHTRIIETNDVPLRVPPRGEKGHAACRYSAMCGVDASPGRSNYDAVPSLGSYEMVRMGWADVRRLEPGPGGPTTHTVGPLFATGRVVEVPLAEGSGADVLRVENRQRLGYFDTYPSTIVPDATGRPDPYYGTVYRDLAATGLLVTLAAGDPSGPAHQYRYDVLLPSGRHDIGRTRCSGTSPGCAPYDVDRATMYRPGVATQVTPWTRPNVNGFTHTPEGRGVNWFAIDRIRFTGAADSTMAFDFVPDVRRADEVVIRDPSWMGAETDGLALPHVRVEAGATLTVEAGVTVTFAGGLEVEPGGRFVCEAGATCVR